jgi:aspartate/methionine/tyrosine aminotransferase
MRIADFALERYFAKHEFSTPHILCSSDIQGMAMRDVLALADDDARQRWDDLTLGYTETAGLPALRAEIASMYSGISPDDVLTFAGAEEAVYIAANVLLGPGDHMITTWPGYQSLYEVGRATGADVTLIELKPAQKWKIDIEALRRAVRPNTKLILLNVPHNPTGATLTHDEWRTVVDIAEAAGAYLFADEVYRLLEYNPADRLPAACELSTRGLSLSVMSKAFGLAGLRVGWLVIRDSALRARMMAYKDYTTICNSAPSEILSLIALRARTRMLARSRSIVLRNLQLFHQLCMDRPQQLRMVAPQAGSVAFPELLGDTPIADAADTLKTQHGVLVLPATVYGYPGNFFRIGFGKEDFDVGLRTFAAYLDTLPGATA